MIKITFIFCSKKWWNTFWRFADNAMKLNGRWTCLQEEWILSELHNDLNSNEVASASAAAAATDRDHHGDECDKCVSEPRPRRQLWSCQSASASAAVADITTSASSSSTSPRGAHHITAIHWQRWRSSFWFSIFPSQLLLHLFIQPERCHQVIAIFSQHIGSSLIIK